MPYPASVTVNRELRQVERIITRPDGRRVRYLTHDFTSPFCAAPQLLTDVFLDSETGWVLQATDSPYPGKSLQRAGITRAQYLATGRPPAIAAAGPGQLLKATQEARILLYGH